MFKHNAPISGIATNGNNLVLTAGYDNQVILWDAETKSPTKRVFHDHLANQCSFSPCGNYVATTSSDYSCRIWMLPNLILKSVINIHTDDVESLSFHPSLELIATCSRDHTIAISDFSGNVKHLLRGHTADVISVAWNKKNEIISSSDDGTIRIWDTKHGCETKCIDLDNVETDTIIITPTGVIHAGNDNGEIITIDSENISVTTAHEAGIKRLVYDIQQDVIVSLSYDRTMKLWCQLDGKLKNFHTTQLPSIIWPRSCAFIDKDSLVFATFGDSYAQYNIPNQKWDLEHINPTSGLNAVKFFNGDTWSVGDSGTVYCSDQPVRELGSLCNFICEFNGRLLTGGQMGAIFDIQSGNIIYQHHSPLNCAVSSSTPNPICVIGTYTGEGIILHIHDGDIKVSNVVNLHSNAIKGIALSNNHLFSVCADGAIAFHKRDNFECEYYKQDAHEKIANGCDGSSTGTFVSVSRDLHLYIWKNKSPTVIKTPSLHSIKCVALSFDQKKVAIGNYTGWIGIYDIDSGSWCYWKRRSFFGVSSITTTMDNFIFSTYGGIHEYVIQR